MKAYLWAWRLTSKIDPEHSVKGQREKNIRGELRDLEKRSSNSNSFLMRLSQGENKERKKWKNKIF